MPTVDRRDPSKPVDAFLLVSFGGPERSEQVMPFLRRVTAGRGVPDERLATVAEHYELFGGRSPINDQNRDLLVALESEFESRGIDVPLYWGNRNWDPMLADTLRTIAAAGHRRVAVFVTSAYPSYSGCRQYREDLAAAVTSAGIDGVLDLVRIPHYADHPGFVAPFADGLSSALARLPTDSHTMFVTHSIPMSMDATSGVDGHAYTTGHRRCAARVVACAGLGHGGARGPAALDPAALDPAVDLAFCSRSGPPSVPWLEPDVNTRLVELAELGVPGVALVPIGFVSDHMEVRFDLDTEAAATARRAGLAFERVPTPGTDARFVTAIADLLIATAGTGGGGEDWSAGMICAAGCCPNPRGHRPALCGSD